MQKIIFLLVFLLIGGAVGLFLLKKLNITAEQIEAVFTPFIAYLREHPFLFILALCTLTSLPPIPCSLLIIPAGLVFPPMFEQYGKTYACIITVVCMTISASWSYWVAAGPLQKQVARLLERFGYKYPNLQKGDRLMLSAMMRITPGMPFFVQNFTMGLVHVPYRYFLFFLLALTAPQICLFVVLGSRLEQMLQGEFKPVLFILLGIVVVALASRLTFGYLKKRKNARLAKQLEQAEQSGEAS